MSDVDTFLDHLCRRLDKGHQDYGDRSFVRPVAETVDQVDQELIDQVGWLYVLWCQAARKTDYRKDQASLRPMFIDHLRHRLARNDRRAAHDAINLSAQTCMSDLEVLAMDMFEFRQQVLRRLHPLARAIEVAQVMDPTNHYRTRRGSTRDPRSDD